MATQVLMPKIGFSMNEGKLTEWLVGNGATVRKGQPLYSIESEKSIQEIEAPADGKLKIIAVADGTYLVGAVLAEIE